MFLTPLYDLFVTVSVLLLTLTSGVLGAILLFNHKSRLWQIAIGSVLSLILFGFSLLLLSISRLGISYESLVAVLSLLTFIELLSVLSKFRQSIMAYWARQQRPRVNTFTAYNLFICLLFFVVLIGGIPTAFNQNRQGFTELYIVEAFEQPSWWQKEVANDMPIDLTIGIENHERTTATYTVHILSKEFDQMVTVADVAVNEQVHLPITLSSRITSENKIEILLYRDNDQIPYRSLSFWLGK